MRAVQSQENYLSFRWVHVTELDQVNLRPAPLRQLLREKPAGGWWGSAMQRHLADQPEHDLP